MSETHQNNTTRSTPTHRCKVCGALWKLWEPGEALRGDQGSWSLASPSCGKCCDNAAMGEQIEKIVVAVSIPMIMVCPACGGRHIDEGEFATKLHHTHACQHCGTVWRPAIVPTVGVQFLPGFKNES